MERIPVRVLVDTDPVFTQIRHLTDPVARSRAADHTAFFSFGENIGQQGCTMPRRWLSVAAHPPADGDGRLGGDAEARRCSLTTIMLWTAIRLWNTAGLAYAMKAESFGPYVDLPSRCRDTFTLGLGSPTEPRERLERHGWAIVDPREPTRDPWTYQDFIGQSKAEFSVAKHGYAASQSGWFSERSAAYLWRAAAL